MKKVGNSPDTSAPAVIPEHAGTKAKARTKTKAKAGRDALIFVMRTAIPRMFVV